MTAQVKVPVDQIAIDAQFLKTAGHLFYKREMAVRDKVMAETGVRDRFVHIEPELLADLTADECAHFFPSVAELSVSRGVSFTVRNQHIRPTVQNPTWKGSHNVVTISLGDKYVRFEWVHWQGLCAMAMLNRLTCGNGYLGDTELRDAVALGMKAFLRSAMHVHRVQFGYSEEEVPYQDELFKEWGGYDLDAPWPSFKTGNMIHSAVLDLANAADISYASDMMHENAERRDDYDDDYDERELFDDRDDF